MATKEVIRRAEAICEEWIPSIEYVLEKFHTERGSPFVFGYCEAHRYRVNNGVRDETVTKLGVYWDIKNLYSLKFNVSLDGEFRLTLELPSDYHLGLDEGWEKRLYTRLGEAVDMGDPEAHATIDRRRRWLETTEKMR